MAARRTHPSAHTTRTTTSNTKHQNTWSIFYGPQSNPSNYMKQALTLTSLGYTPYVQVEP
eukprot:13868300-Ditylum_brightwellii.AAC.1